MTDGGASEYFVALEFDSEGAQAFGDATTRLYQEGGTISIWLDDQNISVATVNSAITDGQAVITGSGFTRDDCGHPGPPDQFGRTALCPDGGQLFHHQPHLGENSLEAMVFAGIIAFIVVFAIMTVMYRLPGVLACVGLLGQVAATLAFVSGYFPVFNSFTLTLPASRASSWPSAWALTPTSSPPSASRRSCATAKSLPGALKSGFARGLTPVIDGNVTIVIVAVVLMGAFGPTDGIFARLLNFVFFPFGACHRGYHLRPRLHSAHRRSAQLCVRCLWHPRDDLGCFGHQGSAEPWLYGADREKKGAPADRLCGQAEGFPDLLLLPDGGHRPVRGGAGGPDGHRVHRRRHDHPELPGPGRPWLGGAGGEQALDNTNLTLQTGENVATGEATLKISLPGSETVTTDQVSALLDNLAASCPDNQFASCP